MDQRRSKQNLTRPNGNQIEIQFLKNFMELASHSSSATSKVLHAKLRQTTSLKLRRILITRIFAEYIASFELFAALCLAIRGRKSSSIIETLSTYSSDEVRRFYQSVYESHGSFDFMSYLALPTMEDILRRTDNPEAIHAYEYSSQALSRRVSAIADQLGGLEFLPVHTHNKIKHGSAFVDDPEILKRLYSYGPEWEIKHNENRVYVMPKTKIGPSGQRRMIHPPTVLDATAEFSDKLVSNTHQVCKSAKEVAAMVLLMDHFDLLD